MLRILAKSIAATLLAFVLLGAVAWFGLDWLLARLGIDDARVAGSDGIRGVIAIALVLLGGWLLWRILALAVLQFFADEVVEAVEAKHYPQALATARKLGWREELANGLRGGGRALLFNAIALPFAIILLVTGIGPALLFWAVNAVVLGRELQDVVWLRHRHALDAPAPLRKFERFALGGIVAALLIVPLVNLLAAFIGAAMATHLVHRKVSLPHAA